MSQTKTQLVEGLNINTSAPADALVINSSGRIGVGASTPNNPMVVAASATGAIPTDQLIGANDSGSCQLGVWNRSDSATYSAIAIETRTNAASRWLIANERTGDYTGDLLFRGRNGTTTSAEVVRFTSTGRVGIGTTSPGQPLHIAGADAQALIAASSGTGTVRITRGATAVETYATSTNGFVGTVSNTNFNLLANNSVRATIDTSGRLLVGSGSTPATGRLFVTGNSTTPSAGGSIHIQRGESATGMSSGDTIGQLKFADINGGEFADILCAVDAAPGSGDLPGRLVFRTTADSASSPTERMRITKDGLIEITGPGYTPTSNSAYLQQASDGDFYLINRGNNFVRLGTNNTQRFLIANDGYLYAQSTSTGNTNLTLRNNSSAADSTDYFQLRDNANNLDLVIKPDGDVENANNSYTGFSDVKLKENIVDASSQWDDIKALRVRNYNYKESTGYSTHRQIGVIAQELELVSPGLVKESVDTGDGPDGEHEVDLGTTTKSVNYSVLYMKAVKALQEAMERIETLETANASLEARLTALEGA